MDPIISAHPMRLLIRRLESIATLTPDEKQAVECLPIAVKDVPSQYDIVQIGDRPSHCCLILRGWACRYFLLDHGKRQILSFHMAGDIPDLMSLHLGVMDHSLCTLGPSRVALISHKDVRAMIVESPTLAAAFWREALVDSATFRQSLTSIGRRSATERVAHLACELYVRQRALGFASDFRCSVPFTQTDLADALGLTNVHINRVLKELRSAGLVTLRSGQLVIHRWHDLVEMAEFDPLYLYLNAEEALC